MLSRFYIPCDDCNMPLIVLEWAGFHTNTQVMCEAGWQVQCLYNRFTRKYKVQFYHPTLFMTFYIKVESIDDLDGKSFEVDFISVGGRRNRRPARAEYITELTADDVPILLEVAVELQKPVRKKQLQDIELPEAHIVTLRRKAI